MTVRQLNDEEKKAVRWIDRAKTNDQKEIGRVELEKIRQEIEHRKSLKEELFKGDKLHWVKGEIGAVDAERDCKLYRGSTMLGEIIQNHTHSPNETRDDNYSVYIGGEQIETLGAIGEARDFLWNSFLEG